MNSGIDRPRSPTRTAGLEPNSAVLAKRRRLNEDIKNLYEDFGTVMDEYEETDYEEEIYEETDYEQEEDYHCSDCSSEDGSDCCMVCNGDFLMQTEDEDDEDEDQIDEDDDYDQDEDVEGEESEGGDAKKDNTAARVKEDRRDNEKDGGKAVGTTGQDVGDSEVTEVVEPVWHPLFKPDIPKVVLLSNDNQKLSVDRHTLCSNR